MADQNIKVKVDLDVSEFNKNAKAMSAALSNILGKDVEIFNGRINKTKQLVEQTEKAMGGATASITKAGNAVKQSNQQWTNLALVIQDLPFGFRGIQNNLPALAAGFAGVTGPIYLAVSSLIAIWTAFGDEITKVIFKTSEASKNNKLLSDTFKSVESSVVQAYTSVDKMNFMIEEAKKGYISKDKVVKEYNETLGKTIGQQTSFNGVVDAMKSKGEKYIELVTMMSFANALAAQSAKEAFTALMAEAKAPEEALGSIQKFGKGALGTVENLINSLRGKTKDMTPITDLLYGVVGSVEKGKVVQDANKSKTILDSFLKSIRKDISDFAKENKFNLFDFKDVKPPSTKEAEKLAAFMAKRIAQAGGDIEVIKEPELDPKAQAKAFAAKMAFDKKMSRERVNLLKEQYQIEVSEAQGSFEQIKTAEENMRNALNQGFMDGTIKLDEYLSAIQELRKKSNKTVSDEAKASMEEMVKMGIGIMNALGPALDMLLEKGANIGEVLSKAFEDVIKKLIKVAIAAAIAVALLSIIFPNTVAKAGGALKMFGNLTAGGMGLGTQLFANGGIVSGPTLGLMGEYPGAANNPEVVAPLDKLQSLIGGSGGTLEARISGNDLLILMNKAGRNNNNTF